MSETLASTPIYADPDRGLGAGIRAARSSGNILLQRWFGCWIDFLAAGACFFLLPFAVGIVSAILKQPVGEPSTALLIIMFLLPVAYYVVTEAVWGRSLGKLISGTIVVDAEGNRVGLWRILVRTLARLLEVNPFLLGGLPAGLMVLFTKNRQRLGDVLAGTYVVPVKTLGQVRAKMAQRDLAVFD